MVTRWSKALARNVLLLPPRPTCTFVGHLTKRLWTFRGLLDSPFFFDVLSPLLMAFDFVWVSSPPPRTKGQPSLLITAAGDYRGEKGKWRSLSSARRVRPEQKELGLACLAVSSSTPREPLVKDVQLIVSS